MSSIAPVNKPCVSVILPSYSVDSYLRAALDSALGQTLANIEIIPVDNGSSGTCSEIIREYARKDSRIRPIYQENIGYGASINAGIKLASGEYLAILKPDDYIMEDYYYILYHEAKKDDLDVCGVNAYCEVRELEPPKLMQTHWIDNPDYMSFEDINEYLSFGNVGITLKIYKKSFIDSSKIALKEDLEDYSDIAFIAEIMHQANKIRIIVGTGYYYRKNTEFSRDKRISDFFKIVEALEYVLSLANKYKVRSSRKSALFSFSLSNLLYLANRSNNQYNENEFRIINHMISKILGKQSALKIDTTYKSYLSSISNDLDLKLISFMDKKLIKSDSKINIGMDYYKQQHFMSNLIAEISFYMYLSISNRNIPEIHKMAKELYKFISNFPGFEGRYINDFIENYFRIVKLDQSKILNTSTYISFLYYIRTMNDDIYVSRIHEHVNNTDISKSVIQWIPNIAQTIDKSSFSMRDNVNKSAVIKKLNDNYEKKFLKFIGGKSIAVVGNAPSEIGRKKGKEIDSHDLVVRFNNFSTDFSHIEDYGKKTNVWTITQGISTLYYQEDFYNFDFVLSSDINLILNEEKLNFIYNYLVAGGRFFNFNSSECRKYTNMITVSTGLYFLYYLYSHINICKKVSVYGFEPLTSKQKNRHYYSDDPIKTIDLKHHDWNKESMIINDLKKKFEKHNIGER